MARHVAIRVDSSLQIGTGHVFRCLALARKLRCNGYQVFFICRELPGNLIKLIVAQGFRVIPLSYVPSTLNDNNHCPYGHWLAVDYDLEIAQSQTAVDNYLSEQGFVSLDWMIVDHYGLEARWHELLKRQCRRIMQIDDLADRPFSCDLLLDQNFYLNMEHRYSSLCPQTTVKLLGPEYALLSDAFLALRRQLASFQHRRANGQVLFFFGGIDRDNETLKALKGVAPLLQNYCVKGQVILGEHNPHRHEVVDYCQDYSRLEMAIQVDDMAMRMSNSFIYIGAVGATVWERCTLGLPAITSTVAANQQPLASSLSQIDAHLCLGSQQETTSADYRIAFEALMSDPKRLEEQAQRVALLTDGLGSQRVLDTMESLSDE